MKIKFLFPIAAMAIGGVAMGQGHDHEHHGTRSANEYMHQTQVADLIKNFESPERDAYQRPQAVLEYLGGLKGKDVFDIGAGSGYFSVKLAAAGARVIAADLDDEFQAALGKRIAEENLQHIELRKLAYDSPGLKDGEVDMALVVNTYHHIDDRPAYFAKVRKGLKPGGELVSIDFFKVPLPVGPPVDHKISMDEAIAELKQAGFTRFTVNVDLLPYQYIIRAQ